MSASFDNEAKVQNVDNANNLKNEGGQPHANPQICVCFDVYQDEILAQIKAGESDFNRISEITYACQGCGSCAPKIEALIIDFVE